MISNLYYCFSNLKSDILSSPPKGIFFYYPLRFPAIVL